jgi:hypothetical protein
MMMAEAYMLLVLYLIHAPKDTAFEGRTATQTFVEELADRAACEQRIVDYHAWAKEWECRHRPQGATCYRIEVKAHCEPIQPTGGG